MTTENWVVPLIEAESAPKPIQWATVLSAPPVKAGVTLWPVFFGFLAMAELDGRRLRTGRPAPDDDDKPAAPLAYCDGLNAAIALLHEQGKHTLRTDERDADEAEALDYLWGAMGAIWARPGPVPFTHSKSGPHVRMLARLVAKTNYNTPAFKAAVRAWREQDWETLAKMLPPGVDYMPEFSRLLPASADTKAWIAALVTRNAFGLAVGQAVAASSSGNGDLWVLMKEDGQTVTVAASELPTLLTRPAFGDQSHRDPQDAIRSANASPKKQELQGAATTAPPADPKPAKAPKAKAPKTKPAPAPVVVAPPPAPEPVPEPDEPPVEPDPADLAASADAALEVPRQNPLTPAERPADYKPVIPPERMTPEQKAISDRFAQYVAGNKQSHLMISALAGSGKTTMLRHLAVEHQHTMKANSKRWLYLVFNTKNKVEAQAKFPDYVECMTTNGFLGRLVENNSSLPSTKRMVSLKRNDDDRVGEKIGYIADSKKFWDNFESRGFPFPQSPQSKAAHRNMPAVLKRMRAVFTDTAIELAGLAKAFAINPEDANAQSKLEELVRSYAIDISLESVKQQLRTYSPGYARDFMPRLQRVLGYDLLAEDFSARTYEATLQLLRMTAPGAYDGAINMADYNEEARWFRAGSYRDFDDDLWYAAVHADKIDWPAYDTVLADEVQDFNVCQQIVLRKLHEAGARIVAVGDANQAIYRFRGADSQSFGHTTQMLEELSAEKDITLPITTAFRNRPAIIDFVNQHTIVKNLRGRTFADGQPGTATLYTVEYGTIFDSIKQAHAGDTAPSIAIICRTNEPLASAALSLLALGVPFVIVGRDLLRMLMGLIALGTKIAGRGATASAIRDALIGYLPDQKRKAARTTAGRAAYMELTAEVQAIVSCIGVYLNDGQPDNGESLKTWIKQRLGGIDAEGNERDAAALVAAMNGPKPPVAVTTTHRVKGLEFNRVYVMRNDLFPHPKAETPEDKEQEEKMRYVTYTRAIDEMHVLKLEGQPGYKTGGGGPNDPFSGNLEDTDDDANESAEDNATLSEELVGDYTLQGGVEVWENPDKRTLAQIAKQDRYRVGHLRGFAANGNLYVWVASEMDHNAAAKEMPIFKLGLPLLIIPGEAAVISTVQLYAMGKLSDPIDFTEAEGDKLDSYAERVAKMPAVRKAIGSIPVVWRPEETPELAVESLTEAGGSGKQPRKSDVQLYVDLQVMSGKSLNEVKPMAQKAFGLRSLTVSQVGLVDSPEFAPPPPPAAEPEDDGNTATAVMEPPKAAPKAAFKAASADDDDEDEWEDDEDDEDEDEDDEDEDEDESVEEDEDEEDEDEDEDEEDEDEDDEEDEDEDDEEDEDEDDEEDEDEDDEEDEDEDDEEDEDEWEDDEDDEEDEDEWEDDEDEDEEDDDE